MDHVTHATYVAILLAPFLSIAVGIYLLFTAYLKPKWRLVLIGIGVTLIAVGLWSGIFVEFGQPGRAGTTKTSSREPIPNASDKETDHIGIQTQ